METVVLITYYLRLSHSDIRGIKTSLALLATVPVEHVLRETGEKGSSFPSQHIFLSLWLLFQQ